MLRTTLIAFLLSFAGLSAADAPLLILNMANTPDALPKHFRIFNDLRISGSGQFSDEGLKTILQKIGKQTKIVVIDLRQESHGFLNGMAVSWYGFRNWANKGKSPAMIAQEETQLLQALLKEKNIIVSQIDEKTAEGGIEETSKLSVIPKTADDEAKISQNHSVDYFRLYITDHMRPSDEEVNRFITFVNQLPQGTWIHFHCAAGDGRTTTFMAMYDMMRNSKQVPFEDILRRQYSLGGIDLLEPHHKSSWKYPLAMERTEFLKKFYAYTKKNTDHYKTSWTTNLNLNTAQ